MIEITDQGKLREIQLGDIVTYVEATGKRRMGKVTGFRMSRHNLYNPEHLLEIGGTLDVPLARITSRMRSNQKELVF